MPLLIKCAIKCLSCNIKIDPDDGLNLMNYKISLYILYHFKLIWLIHSRFSIFPYRSKRWMRSPKLQQKNVTLTWLQCKLDLHVEFILTHLPVYFSILLLMNTQIEKNK